MDIKIGDALGDHRTLFTCKKSTQASRLENLRSQIQSSGGLGKKEKVTKEQAMSIVAQITSGIRKGSSWNGYLRVRGSSGSLKGGVFLQDKNWLQMIFSANRDAETAHVIYYTCQKAGWTPENLVNLQLYFSRCLLEHQHIQAAAVYQLLTSVEQKQSVFQTGVQRFELKREDPTEKQGKENRETSLVTASVCEKIITHPLPHAGFLASATLGHQSSPRYPHQDPQDLDSAKKENPTLTVNDTLPKSEAAPTDDGGDAGRRVPLAENHAENPPIDDSIIPASKMIPADNKRDKITYILRHQDGRKYAMKEFAKPHLLALKESTSVRNFEITAACAKKNQQPGILLPQYYIVREKHPHGIASDLWEVPVDEFSNWCKSRQKQPEPADPMWVPPNLAILGELISIDQGEIVSKLPEMTPTQVEQFAIGLLKSLREQATHGHTFGNISPDILHFNQETGQVFIRRTEDFCIINSDEQETTDALQGYLKPTSWHKDPNNIYTHPLLKLRKGAGFEQDLYSAGIAILVTDLKAQTHANQYTLNRLSKILEEATATLNRDGLKNSKIKNSKTYYKFSEDITKSLFYLYWEEAASHSLASLLALECIKYALNPNNKSEKGLDPWDDVVIDRVKCPEIISDCLASHGFEVIRSNASQAMKIQIVKRGHELMSKILDEHKREKQYVVGKLQEAEELPIETPDREKTIAQIKEQMCLWEQKIAKASQEQNAMTDLLDKIEEEELTRQLQEAEELPIRTPDRKKAIDTIQSKHYLLKLKRAKKIWDLQRSNHAFGLIGKDLMFQLQEAEKKPIRTPDLEETIDKIKYKLYLLEEKIAEQVEDPKERTARLHTITKHELDYQLMKSKSGTMEKPDLEKTIDEIKDKLYPLEVKIAEQIEDPKERTARVHAIKKSRILSQLQEAEKKPIRTRNSEHHIDQLKDKLYVLCVEQAQAIDDPNERTAHLNNLKKEFLAGKVKNVQDTEQRNHEKYTLELEEAKAIGDPQRRTNRLNEIKEEDLRFKIQALQDIAKIKDQQYALELEEAEAIDDPQRRSDRLYRIKEEDLIRQKEAIINIAQLQNDHYNVILLQKATSIYDLEEKCVLRNTTYKEQLACRKTMDTNIAKIESEMDLLKLKRGEKIKDSKKRIAPL